MQSRISVSLAQCSGDPGEAPPIFRPRDRPPPLSKGLVDRQLLPPPPPLISRSGYGTEVEFWRGNCERLPVNFPVTKLS